MTRPRHRPLTVRIGQPEDRPPRPRAPEDEDAPERWSGAPSLLDDPDEILGEDADEEEEE